MRPVALPDERIGRCRFSRRGVAIGVSLSALAGFVSWCAVTGVNLLAFPQDQMFSKQPHAAAASYYRQTP